jgi:Reverse transcriptase (RNA-dependent DNA polymerase).
LKQGDALSPLLFNFTLEYAVKKVQEINLGLDMNGTHQVLAYADDVNLIGDDIRIERNADVLLNACNDIGLAVKTGKTKYMEVGRHRDMTANEHSVVGSNSYENVKIFITFRLFINISKFYQLVNLRKEIHVIIQSKHVSRILSKNLKMKIRKTVILPVQLYMVVKHGRLH